MTPIRLKLLLGRFRVTNVSRTATGFKMSIELPGLGHMHCDVPAQADVRENDLLTLYTEILSNAKSDS